MAPKAADSEAGEGHSSGHRGRPILQAGAARSAARSRHWLAPSGFTPRCGRTAKGAAQMCFDEAISLLPLHERKLRHKP